MSDLCRAYKNNLIMIWDFLSDYYDVFENICNGRVNRLLCKRVARRMSPGDEGILPASSAEVCVWIRERTLQWLNR